MEKSYVGLTQCFFCGEDSGLVMDRHLRPKFERRVGVIDMEPCSECKKLMEQGVMLISVRDGEGGSNPYRTGAMAVITDDAIKRMVSEGDTLDNLLSSRWGFVEDEIWDAVGLPREDIDNRGVANV